MSSSTTSTSSSTSSRDPWAPTSSGLKSVASKYKGLINKPAAFTPNSEHQGGLERMQWLGNLNNGGTTAFDRYLAAQQYLPGMMDQASARHGAGGNVLGEQATQGDANILNAGNLAHGNMQRAQGLGDQARNTGGSWADWYADKSNPYLDQTIQDANNDAMRAIKSQFTGVGRNIGSGAFGDVAADRLGTIATQARMQNYGNERNLYEQAQAQGRSLGQGYEQLGQGYTGQVANAAAQNANLMSGAANSLYGGGAQQMLQGSGLYDNTLRQQLADNWEVSKDAAGLLHAGDTGLNAINDYGRQAKLQSISWPGQGLQALGSSFGEGMSFGSATQPNTGLIPGIASTGLGLLGGGLF